MQPLREVARLQVREHLIPLNHSGAQGTFDLDSGLPGAIAGAFRSRSFALLATAGGSSRLIAWLVNPVRLVRSNS